MDDIIEVIKTDLEKKKILRQLGTIFKKRFQSRLKISDFADQADHIIEQDKMDLRAERNKLYLCCLTLTNTLTFSRIVNLSIILNTAVLASDRYALDEETQKQHEHANMLFAFIFTVEMIIKMIAFGFGSYFRDRQNKMDFSIVVFSIIDVCIFYYREYMIKNHDFNDKGKLAIWGEVTTVFAIARLFRVLKLAKAWTSFDYFLVTIIKTMSRIGSFAVVLLLFMFTFSMLGMELFANKLRFGFDDKAVPYFGDYSNDPKVSRNYSYPPSNFDNFPNAFISVFIVLTNDGWTPIYWDHYRIQNQNMESVATLFFTLLVVFGQWILFNLFLAILLKEFDERGLIQRSDSGKKSGKNGIV